MSVSSALSMLFLNQVICGIEQISHFITVKEEEKLWHSCMYIIMYKDLRWVIHTAVFQAQGKVPMLFNASEQNVHQGTQGPTAAEKRNYQFIYTGSSTKQHMYRPSCVCDRHLSTLQLTVCAVCD